ncbi:MAG: hypothetical protein FWC41_13280, partial [Firmicutes bacterium]|nr:hypothetical protein [Bacillota bacterium]
MNRKIILFIFIFLATHTTILAQEFYKRDRKYVDTATFMIWISPAFSVQSPFGNGYLASTFNFNYNIGAEITAKTKSNWTFGVAFNYMFGSKVKAAPKDILGDILFYHQISEDEIIPVTFNGAGTNSMVLTYEGRYWYLGGSVGKVIPLDRWRNSGLLINVGAGFFSHKINFTDPYHFFPQIDQKTYR